MKEVRDFRIRFIFADSSHPFENKDLQNALSKLAQETGHRCTLIEVKFSVDKEAMLGNYRAHFQRRLLRIPKMYQEAIWQHKRYHYQPKSDKPAKEADHIPDATMLALKRWQLNLQASRLPEQKPMRRDTVADKKKDERSARPETEKSTLTGGMLTETF